MLRRCLFLALTMFLASFAPAISTFVLQPIGAGAPVESPRPAAYPPWVEPRLLNIVDIAGQVPDDILRDNIVAYNPAGGIARFVSSAVTSGYLQVTVRIDSRFHGYHSGLTMLSQRPLWDVMGSAVPETWVRLYASWGQEITDRVAFLRYMDPAFRLPLANTNTGDKRYPETQTERSQLPLESFGLRLPPSYGGEIYVAGDYPVVTAVFTIPRHDHARVTYLGLQDVTFQSFVGDYNPGDAGLVDALAQQLKRRYKERTGETTRHPRIPLHKPAGANYILFNYPPMPFDICDRTNGHLNLLRPVGGTTRLAITPTNQQGGMLSQGFMQGGAVPLLVAWQARDQVLYDRYLSLMPPIDAVTPPEHILPAGVPWDDCYLSGDCSDWKLDRILDAIMPLRFTYLRVEPNQSGLVALPLRIPSKNWIPSQGIATALDLVAEAPDRGPYRSFVADAVPGARVPRGYLPLVVRPLPTSTPTPTRTPAATPTHTSVPPSATPPPTSTTIPTPPVSERPSGFFDPSTGCMVGYAPRQ